MDNKKIQERIQELRESLERHNYNYYVLSKPEISDYEFDMMMEELIRLERDEKKSTPNKPAPATAHAGS